jgi:IS5 family transposase
LHWYVGSAKTQQNNEEWSLQKMRKANHKQLPLLPEGIDHRHASELKGISRILDDNPIINELVLQDLNRGLSHHHTGAEGMSAEQILRAAIVKQMGNYSYEALAFHLVDSQCYRKFCRIGIAHKGFKKSALCSNIKAICSETWEAINRILVAYGDDKKIERGRQSRIDCTVVDANIHEPSDSSLLWDAVRVLSRILRQINERIDGLSVSFSDHTKRAKRRMVAIKHAKTKSHRHTCYKDLLSVTTNTLNYAKRAVPLLESYPEKDPLVALTAQKLAEDLKGFIALTEKIIDQTTRRVIQGEKVPAAEKVVSLFEPHTDIIVKDRRDTLYGHKVCLSGGPSNLITDCLIVSGNPADVSLAEQMLDRHEQVFGRYPLKVAFDGGFASQHNLAAAKGRRIKDVCFAKKRGIKEQDMCRSQWMYKKLKRFRAGIESGISWLKRCFGFSRCTWKSLRSFKSYVWASVVSANLLTLARSGKTTT